MIVIFLLLLPVFVRSDCPGPSSFVGELNTCLHVDNQVAPFKFADKYCAAFGGRLISISSSFQNAIISGLEITRTAGSQLYVGATSAPDGIWKWTDGTPFSYQKWAPGEPRSGECAYLSATDTLWRSIDCSTPLPFFCEFPQTVPIDCTTPGSAISCPPSFIYVAALQTCVYADNDAVSFSNAEKYCTAFGGHLFSFHGLEIEGIVTGMAITDIHSPMFYIGYNNPNGTWQWTDQSPNNYDKWANGPGSANCAAINVSSSYWNGVDCSSSLPYMCNIPPVLNGGCTTTSVPATETAIPVTEEPIPSFAPIQCQDPDLQGLYTCQQGWTYYANTGFFYFVGFNSTWQGAEDSCVAMGAHLTSIHSQDEDDFIRALCCMANCGERSVENWGGAFWIGASGAGSLTWTDGTPNDFSRPMCLNQGGNYYYLGDATCTEDGDGDSCWGTSDSGPDNFPPYYVCKYSYPGDVMPVGKQSLIPQTPRAQKLRARASLSAHKSVKP